MAYFIPLIVVFNARANFKQAEASYEIQADCISYRL